MTFRLTELPYSRNALEPYISSRTLDFHYGKHHSDYVDKLNTSAAGTRYENMALEEVIQASHQANERSIFNNASQAWNHTFFWDSMTPDGSGSPQGALAGTIDRQFGSVDTFRQEFREAATGQFGSGWAWLIADEDTLAIVSTSDADSPLTTATTPLLTLDVWEHAYYLDYQNSRDKFVDAFLEHLINWEFVEENLDSYRTRKQLDL